MIPVLIVVCAVLSVLTVLNMILCFAIVRRLREVPDAASHTETPENLPEIGMAITDFEVTLTDGGSLDRAALGAEPTLVAFVMPNCEPCHAFATQMVVNGPPRDLRLVSFVAGEADQAVDHVRDLSPHGMVAVIPSRGHVADAFGGITAFPTLMRVEDGVVTAAGWRIDDVVPAGHRTLAKLSR